MVDQNMRPRDTELLHLEHVGLADGYILANLSLE